MTDHHAEQAPAAWPDPYAEQLPAEPAAAEQPVAEPPAHTHPHLCIPHGPAVIYVHTDGERATFLDNPAADLSELDPRERAIAAGLLGYASTRVAS